MISFVADENKILFPLQCLNSQVSSENPREVLICYVKEGSATPDHAFNLAFFKQKKKITFAE